MTNVSAEVEGSDDGFTLIEILIAIVLVGILSAVAIVGISNLTSRGSAASCAASADAARAGTAVYYTATLAYPTTLQQMTTLVPPALILPPGATLNAAAVGTSPIGTLASTPGWTLAMSAGVAGGPPTFACSASSGPGATPSSTTDPIASHGTVACPGAFVNWVGEYYSTVDLTGTPRQCRDDAEINFDWAYGSPAGGGPSNDFSVRWTRSVVFSAGAHTFTMGSDDGSRLSVDGVVVLDYWSDHAYGTQTVATTLSAGSHTIVVEFYERAGIAAVTLTWTP